MDYFNLSCSIALRSLWLYGGYLIFFRKVTFAPLTNNKWAAYLSGSLIVAVVLIDTYRQVFIN